MLLTQESSNETITKERNGYSKCSLGADQTSALSLTARGCGAPDDALLAHNISYRVAVSPNPDFQTVA